MDYCHVKEEDEVSQEGSKDRGKRFGKLSECHSRMSHRPRGSQEAGGEQATRESRMGDAQDGSGLRSIRNCVA